MSLGFCGIDFFKSDEKILKRKGRQGLAKVAKRSRRTLETGRELSLKCVCSESASRLVGDSQNGREVKSSRENFLS